jgi:nucleotide-binding universal stress UspA family protein
MYSKILYPTDFSKDAHKALTYIKTLKSSGTIEVVILHVIEHSKILEYREIQEQIMEASEGLIEVEDAVKKILQNVYPQLKKIEKELIDIGIKAEIVVKEGVASKQIVEVAKQVDAKMIVMGYTGKGILEKLFSGSTVRHVVESTPVSVMIIK